MKKIARFTLSMLLLLLLSQLCLSFAFAEDSENKPVESITLNESSAELYLGDRFTLKAEILPADATDLAVNWSSSDESVATVDQNGNVTPASAGVTKIICSAQDDSGVAGECELTVSVGVAKIEIDNRNVVLLVGGSEDISTVKLTATVTPENASYPEITWTSADPSIAEVDKNGVITGKATGKTRITANTTDPRFVDKITAFSDVVVGEAVGEITINGLGDYLIQGTKANATAVVSPNTAYNGRIEWSSDNDAVLAIDAYGHVTAVGPGTANVLCSSLDGSGVVGQKEITVLPIPDIEILAVTLVAKNNSYIITPSFLNHTNSNIDSIDYAVRAYNASGERVMNNGPITIQSLSTTINGKYGEPSVGIITNINMPPNGRLYVNGNNLVQVYDFNHVCEIKSARFAITGYHTTAGETVVIDENDQIWLGTDGQVTKYFFENIVEPRPEISLEMKQVANSYSMGMYNTFIPNLFAEAFDLPMGGVYIDSIPSDSPMLDNGFVPGEVIVKIGDVWVYDNDSIDAAKGLLKEGEETDVICYYRGERIETRAVMRTDYRL